ncbi:MAG: UDP-N-acetylmuramoylalanyl-D-glutamyl-2, 6-diaminopimelate--D-alanyl-D-alanine ligase, partial [Bdellovibrionales bacterium]|nr:UDP-N-acetylmuramoylalanyl-D-glutamyl-2, 6-diaminopimelate--D-alanyl-D-alanine ligase [Bdellovibrionales bacterium]
GNEVGEAQISVFGRQNLYNVAAAAACALGIGMRSLDIWKALPSCKGLWGRGQVVPLASGASAIFDAYNANPDSYQVLFENIGRTQSKGKIFGIFGEMLEMGDQSEKLHFELGELAAKIPFEAVYFLGTSSEHFKEGMLHKGFRKNLMISNTYEKSLAIKIADMLKPGDIVLIKGSRGNRLEQAFEALNPVDIPNKY